MVCNRTGVLIVHNQQHCDMCFSTKGGGSPTKAKAEQKKGRILGVNRPEIAGVDLVDRRRVHRFGQYRTRSYFHMKKATVAQLMLESAVFHVQIAELRKSTSKNTVGMKYIDVKLHVTASVGV